MAGQVRVPGVGVHQVRRGRRGRHGQVHGNRGQRRIRARQPVPGLVGDCSGPVGALAVHGQADQAAELAGQVLDVHPGAAVHVRRILPGQQRYRESRAVGGHSGTTWPLPTTVTPPAETTNPRAWSCSLSTPICDALGDDDVLIQDRVPDHGMPADPGVVQQHRSLDRGPAVDPDAGAQHGLADQAAGDDDAVADQAVDRPAGSVAVVMHELGRRLGRHAGQDRPPVVVQIEDRVHGAQVHVRVEIGVERPDVAPVARVPLGRSRHIVLQEVVGLHAALADQHRDDVAAHVMQAVVVGRILAQRLHQRVAGEDVVAHRGERLIRMAGAAGRVGGLLQECLDGAPVRADPDHAELGGIGPRHRDGGHGGPAPDSTCALIICTGSIR